MLAAYFCKVSTNQQYFNNDECKADFAASALLVQSGVLLVSHNCFIVYLELSNVKPTQVCSAQAGRQVIPTALGTSKGIVNPNSAYALQTQFDL